MFTHVAPVNIEQGHLRSLANSLLAAPPALRIGTREFVYNLNTGRFQLFEFSNGLIAVSVDAGNKRLKIEALYCRIFQNKRPLLAALKRLAADYGCDTIATSVFDHRFADVIVGLGGKVEAIDLVLPVMERE